jgi:prefoldin alpha subunit
MLEGAAGEMQARIGLVDAALRELNAAGTTIHGLGDMKKDSEILMPIGGGSYIKAKVDDTEKVLINIGAGVTAEKAAKDAGGFVENQTAELNKARSSLQDQLIQVLERMETVRGEIQKISNSLKT